MQEDARREPGVLPAYHMSKAHWLTVLIDGTVDLQKIKILLDVSYTATLQHHSS